VRNHLQTILRKLDVHSQREAVRLALERHLV
jgi:DNA-binding CsgD family transcriptional regulator